MPTTPTAMSAADGRLARRLADEAGRVLLEVRSAAFAAGSPNGSQLKAAGDSAAQGVLARLLAEQRPQDAVLSEEAADDKQRLAVPDGRPHRVWIIDPLDGTREFSEPGRTDWAVHVALWQDGDLVAGTVALPAQGVSYATDEPPVMVAPDPERSHAPLRLAVSRTRPPAFVEQLAHRLGAVLVPMGSAGVKCASVWRGEADAYVHAGGQYEWDSAAPVVVARSAGLHTSRIDGAPLDYNRPDPLLPDLVVCRPELAVSILAVIAELLADVRRPDDLTEVTTR